MPAGAVYVGRPSKWGNPFRVTERRYRALSVMCFKEALAAAGCPDERLRKFWADKGFGWMARNISQLRGKDLVCWCGPKELCHADVLLDYANK